MKITPAGYDKILAGVILLYVDQRLMSKFGSVHWVVY